MNNWPQILRLTKQKRSVGAFAAGFLALCYASNAVAQTHAGTAFLEPYFTAPVSGQKVSRYSVDLPTKAGDRTLQVPADCTEISSLLKTEKADRSRVLDRRLWFKAEHDCRYYALLHRYPRRDLRDYVSRHDFFHLALEELPFDRRCAEDNPNQCALWLIDVSGTTQRISSNTEGRQMEDCESKRIPCQLVNGHFRGHIRAATDGGMVCSANRRTSLRLLSVDYGDINGDGILDAVLRLMQISPAEGRRLLRIPLTRLSADAELITPTRVSSRED